MTRFVDEKILKKSALHRTDVMKKSDKKYVNLMAANYFDLEYITRDALQKCKDVSSKDILLFKQDCRKCLQFLVSKLMEKSSLNIL